MKTHSSTDAVGDAETVALRSPERLAALHATGLMNTEGEERFDRLTRLASRTLKTPVVLVSLLDGTRQFFKSAVGIEKHFGSIRETPVELALCRKVVASGNAIVVPDARQDSAFRDEVLVADFGINAYAGVPLTAIDGQVIGTFCAIDMQPRDWTDDDLSVLQDLAESVMSELRLQQAKDNAEAANHAKDRFLAVLSHELRMPISPALMIVQELIRDQSLPQSVRDDATIIGRNIEQQVRLIDDLLDLTRIENGKLDVRFARMDLAMILRETAAHFAAEASGKRIRLTCDAGRGPVMVNGDAGRLRQVFGNLLRNAIKFTPNHGTVAVTVQSTRDAVYVTVRDTGIGIAAEVLPDLFEAFAQGPRARVREYGGLGLGLAIAKGIIDEHAGSIDARSDGEHTGTTFTVTLPISNSTMQPSPTVAPSRPTCNEPMSNSDTPNAPASLLLVDDHEDTLKAMARLLCNQKHRVFTAGSVAEALAIAEVQQFDILVSDVGLPDGTGLDLMRQLKAKGFGLGIALTGYGTENDHRQTLEAGFAAHLTKPIDMRALAKTIDELSCRILPAQAAKPRDASDGGAPSRVDRSTPSDVG